MPREISRAFNVAINAIFHRIGQKEKCEFDSEHLKMKYFTKDALDRPVYRYIIYTNPKYR
jgi:hypothetical protein